jgi:hypothetical protein
MTPEPKIKESEMHLEIMGIGDISDTAGQI